MKQTFCILSAMALLVPGSAMAAETFSLPATCEGQVTIQKRGCIVTHLFTCAEDPQGYRRRVDLTQDGMVYLGIIDDETQWIESFHPLSGDTTRLGPNISDPASFSDLTATGRDDFDFETTSSQFGVTRYVGYDELTGNDLEVGGEVLLGTEYKVTAYGPDGSEIYSVSGNEFIHPEWRRFLSGIRTISSENGVSERNNTPMELLFPGADGFLSSEPQYDCNVVLSSFEGGL